jgi:hypothetical protein
MAEEDPWKRPLSPPTTPSPPSGTTGATRRPAANPSEGGDEDWDDEEYDEDDDWEDEERQLPSLKRALTAAGTGVALAALAIMAIVFALVMFIRLLD